MYVLFIPFFLYLCVIYLVRDVYSYFVISLFRSSWLYLCI